MRLPRASKPQKLQHILVENRHVLVKAQPRDDDVMKAPDFAPDSDDGDYGESDYSKVKSKINAFLFFRLLKFLFRSLIA